MKTLIAFGAKNVFVPLIPFSVGALIRVLYGVGHANEIFDAGELCFSMAMLCMLAIASAGRLQDADLRDSITSFYLFGVVFFLVLFSISSFLKTQVESGTADILSYVHDAVSSNHPVSLEALKDAHLVKSAAVLANVWRFVVGPSAFAICATLICKTRYGLGD
ncbi:MAG: hypothetical protein ABSC23_12820 [Bryobacteraceae bacterium]|jgi:hypothetical protein